MKLPITCWKNTLRTLGYKVVRTQKKTRSRQLKETNLHYGNLEPRKLLASLPELGPIIDLQVDEGQEFSAVVSYSDLDTGDTHTAVIDWGDGTSESVEAASGEIELSHAYPDDGTYTPTLTITDSDFLSDAYSFDVTVENVAPMFSSYTYAYTYDDNSFDDWRTEFKEGDVAHVSAGFVDSARGDTFTAVLYPEGLDGEAVAIDHSNFFRWEDDGQTFIEVHSELPLQDSGSVNAVIRLTDDDGGFADAPISFDVENVAPEFDFLEVYNSDGNISESYLEHEDDGGSFIEAILNRSIEEGTPFNIAGRFVDPGLNDEFTITFYPDGDLTSTAIAVEDFAVTEFNGQAVINFAIDDFVLEDSGTFRPLLLLSDDDGGREEVPLELEISDVAPVVSLGADQTVVVGGQSVTIAIDSIDPGNDTITEYRVDWGDGVEGSSLTHTYDIAGTHPVRVWVTDNDGEHGPYLLANDIVVTNLIVSTLIDENDGDYTSNDLSLREALALAEQIEGENSITFAAGMTGELLLDSSNGSLQVGTGTSIIGPGRDLLTIRSANSAFELNFSGQQLSGLHLENSYIYVDGPDALLSDLLIDGSSSWLEHEGSKLVVEDSIIRNAELNLWGEDTNFHRLEIEGVSYVDVSGGSDALLSVVDSVILNSGKWDLFSNADFENTHFSGSSPDGLSVLHVHGDTNLNRSTVTNRFLPDSGKSAVYVDAGATFTLAKSVVVGNALLDSGATDFGGDGEILGSNNFIGSTDDSLSVVGSNFSQIVSSSNSFSASLPNPLIGSTEGNFGTWLRDGSAISGLSDLTRPDLLGPITVVFNQRVSLTSDVLRIFNDSEGGTPVSLDGAQFSLSDDGRTATWNLSDLGQSVGAGFYTLSLDHHLISDGLGVSIPYDPAMNQQVRLVLPGDANLDGTVDVLGDAFGLINNLGVTEGATWADGDFNGDGAVDVLGDAFIHTGTLGSFADPEPPPMTISVASSPFSFGTWLRDGQNIEGLGDLARPDQLGPDHSCFQSACVAFTLDALRIFNDSDGGTPVSLDGAEFSLSEDGRTATWNLLELNQTTEAGFYTLSLDQHLITDGLGIALPYDSDMNQQVRVVLPGDANLDGSSRACSAMRSNLLVHLGEAGGYDLGWQGDFNGDGSVDRTWEMPSS